MALESLTIGAQNSTVDPRIKTNFETLSGLLGGSNKIAGSGIENETITNTQLAAAAKPFDWYTPKVIATEQTRESTSFGTLTTADEITGVVLPENGLIWIGYVAKWKSSVAAAGRAAIFLGANQLKSSTSAGVLEASTTGTSLRTLFSSAALGLNDAVGEAALPTTGATFGETGLCPVYAAAGTYAISIQFKATSGSVTAKERKLWVAVLGV